MLNPYSPPEFVDERHDRKSRRLELFCTLASTICCGFSMCVVALKVFGVSSIFALLAGICGGTAAWLTLAVWSTHLTSRSRTIILGLAFAVSLVSYHESSAFETRTKRMQAAAIRAQKAHEARKVENASD